ncbi:MAG: peptidoglycan DD-metalloendopeptidase family protein [Pseudomonadota bacterium]
MRQLISLLVFAVLASSAGQASAAPNFQMPFACGQVWSGSTTTNHNPQNAVDLNRTDDLGDAVVAAASGRVVTVTDLGGTSYGKYVVIDHGSGWKTYYAHLNSFSVSVGNNVSQGQKIGAVGTTGGSTGPHLHHEQRLNGSAQKIVWNGAQILYWGAKSYTSKNGCGSATGAPGTVNTTSLDLNVRSGPGTSYSIVDSLSDGAAVHISCQTTGTTVTGTYGTSNLWDKIGSGRYVPDAYIYTGSDGRVAPNC